MRSCSKPVGWCATSRGSTNDPVEANTGSLAAVRGGSVAVLARLVAARPPQPNRGQFPPNPPPPQPIAIPGGGTDLFRALLDREGIEPVTQRDLNNLWAAATI